MEKRDFSNPYYLYLLRFTAEGGKDYVKIGVTDNLSRRVRDFGGVGKFDLENSYLLKGERSRIEALEKHLHARHHDSKDTRPTGFLSESKEVFDASALPSVINGIEYEVTHYPSGLGTLEQGISYQTPKQQMSHAQRVLAERNAQKMRMPDNALDEAVAELKALDCKLTLHLDDQRYVRAISGMTQQAQEGSKLKENPLFQQKYSQTQNGQEYFFFEMKTPSRRASDKVNKQLVVRLENEMGAQIETRELCKANTLLPTYLVREACSKFFEQHFGENSYYEPSFQTMSQHAQG